MALLAERQFDHAFRRQIRVRQRHLLVGDGSIINPQSAALDLPARLAIGGDEARLDEGRQNARAGCRLQMGGSDQWGNIVNGVDLGRRMGTPQLFALTTPLLTTASGDKMGKTAKGAVWLNADEFSPYDFWQYWRNTEDADVVKFLKLFTILPMGEIAKLAALKGGEINEAKKVLATEATALLHGRDAANKAAETARQTFEEGAIAENLPTVEIPQSELAAGVGVLSAFVKAGLVASNGEARRQIKGGGLRVNDVAVTDEKMTLTPGDLTGEGVIKLSLGKKRHVLLKAA